MTIDGFFAGVDNDLGWEIRDEEIARYVGKTSDSIDTILFGRVTYDLMASYWPTSMAAENEPALFTKFMNDTPKIVFSRSLKKPSWKNTRVIDKIDKEQILKMKKQSGRDMIIFGSGSVVSALSKYGLIDEYLFLVNPVVLGKGRSLFNGAGNNMNLKLEEIKAFSNGVVLHHYTLNGVGKA